MSLLKFSPNPGYGTMDTINPLPITASDDVKPPGASKTQTFDSQNARAVCTNIQIDAVTEKRLLRKLDRRVVSLVFLLYMVAFLDRSNIGNAQTAGMGHDLGFDDGKFQVGLLCW